MNITVLSSSSQHPIYQHILKWKADNQLRFNIEFVLSVEEITKGDFLFMLSCSEFVPSSVRDRFRHSLVVHASALPEGRGWSPHVWDILKGKEYLTVTLLEAEDAIDSGSIWLQEKIQLEGHELYNELNANLFDATFSLIERAIFEESNIKPVKQDENKATYYRKRTPEDSRIDVNKTLHEQLGVLRTADPERYPAFFEHKGFRYKIKIEKDLS